MDVCSVRTDSRWAWRRRPPKFAHTSRKNLHILSLSLCVPRVLPGSPPSGNQLCASGHVLFATDKVPLSGRHPLSQRSHVLGAPPTLGVVLFRIRDRRHQWVGTAGGMSSGSTVSGCQVSIIHVLLSSRAHSLTVPSTSYRGSPRRPPCSCQASVPPEYRTRLVA